MWRSLTSHSQLNPVAADRELSFGIRAKTTLMVSTMLIATAIAVGAAIYIPFRSVLISDKQRHLRNATEVAGANFLASIQSLDKDVLSLAGMPPIQGIIRSQQNGGKDPYDGSTEELWLRRLETIFSVMLRAKPEYSQIRYIGIADQGRELVRVERDENQIVIAPANQLQQKGTRNYFHATTQLSDGQVFLSDLELNREFGEVENPHVPVLRSATPIYAPTGDVFGIVIINCDMRSTLSSLKNSSLNSVMLTNDRGDFLVHPEQEKTFGFEFDQPYRIDEEFPEFSQFTESPQDEMTAIETTADHNESVVSAMKLRFDRYHPERFLALYKTTSNGQVMGEIATLRNRSIAISAVLVAVALFIAYSVSETVTLPISQIVEATEAFRQGKTDVRLPIDNRDETGLLARRFSEMTEKIRERTDNLESEVRRRTLELRKSNQQLQSRNEDLRRSNADLEQFAYVTSHDLQEPLRSIVSFVQLLEVESSDKLDDTEKRYISIVVASAQRMKQLINDLLDYSRVGRMEKPFQQVPSTDAVENAIAFLEFAILDSSASIHYDNLPVVTADSRKLTQLFQNLIGNAIKYRGDAPPEILISAEDDGDKWRFSIQDNGIGIEPRFSSRIFTIFQRLHNHSEYPGTGIGLALCQRIVDGHGGQIHVESQIGQGSTFVFTLSKHPETNSPLPE